MLFIFLYQNTKMLLTKDLTNHWTNMTSGFSEDSNRSLTYFNLFSLGPEVYYTLLIIKNTPPQKNIYLIPSLQT